MITLIWGLAFLAETLADTYLGYHLPAGGYVTIHPILFWGTILVTMGGATFYGKYVLKNLPSR